MIKKFQQYINEAYIDDLGNLQDFEMNPEELSNIELDEALSELDSSFREYGAKNLEVAYNGESGTIHISFNYLGVSMYVRIKIDAGTAIALADWGGENNMTFKGDSNSLAAQIANLGLDSLLS